MLLIRDGEQCGWGGEREGRDAAEGLAEAALLRKGWIDFVTLAPFSPCLPSAPAAPGGPWGGWKDTASAFQHSINTHELFNKHAQTNECELSHCFTLFLRLTQNISKQKELYLFFNITHTVCLLYNALVLHDYWSSPEILSGQLPSLLVFYFTSIKFRIEPLSCLINSWWVLSLSGDDNAMPLRVHYFSYVKIYLSD